MHLLHGLKPTRQAGSNKLMVEAGDRPINRSTGHGYRRTGELIVEDGIQEHFDI
jgi:hypothetical protein